MGYWGDCSLTPERRPLFSRPCVLYYSPASAVAARWDDATRPFDLVTVNCDDGASGDQTVAGDSVGNIDCAVVDVCGDWDPTASIDRVREHDETVPILLVRRGAIEDASSVALTGIDATVTVPADRDPVEVLSALADRIRTLAASRRDRTFLTSLLAHIPVSVYVKDREGRHVAASDAMFGMFEPSYITNDEGKRHHRPADVLGKTDFDLYDDELGERSRDIERQIRDTGEAIENQVERASSTVGAETYVLTTKAPWTDHTGTAQGIIGVTRDVSERKRYETRIQRQNQRLRQLTATVSEAISDSISTAQQRLELARSTGDLTHFDAIECALDRIDTVVGYVLTITRQSEPVTDPAAVDVAAAVRRAWGRLDVEGPTLSIDTDATVRADPGRLQLLFEHLLRNACEHASGDTLSSTVTITVGDRDDGGFFVADDGVGIPPTERETLFEPTFGDPDASAIGLAVVAAIVAAHDWSVQYCEGDGGARFDFSGVRRVGCGSN
ncbi:MAG: ATP-binding protein [Halorhabdus sp.]